MGIAKVWDGSQYVSALLKTYDGSVWTDGRTHFWNGTAQIPLYPGVAGDDTSNEWGVNLDGQLGETWSGTLGHVRLIINVNLDGNVYVIKHENGSNVHVTQIDTGTDWIRPGPPGLDAPWYIKCVDNNGEVNYGNTVGSWFEYVSTRQWGVKRTTDGVTELDINIQISHEASGTPVLANARYTGTLTRG